jgi:hypothetical protein
MAAEKLISISQEHERKRYLKKAPKTVRKHAVSQTADPAQELRTAWLKSVARKKDPANEIRDAWHLH